MEYKKAIKYLIQDWKEFKKTNRDIFFISCIDELRMLEDEETKDLTRIKKVLNIIKSENDPNILYIFTALDPKVFQYSGLSINRTISGRYLDWIITKRMPAKKIEELPELLPDPNDPKEKSILLTILKLTDGHYRTIQSVIFFSFFLFFLIIIFFKDCI